MASYHYGIYTNAAAQLGIVLIFNVYAFTQVDPSTAVMTEPINLCATSAQLCSTSLKYVACPAEYYTNIACRNMNDYNTYEGICSCGSFDSSRVSELIVDALVKSNVTQSMVAVWPNDATTVDSPTEVFDMCLTFENACEHYKNMIACPKELQSISGCDKR